MTKPFVPNSQGPAQIYHLANLLCPGAAQGEGLAVLDHCYLGTRNILDLALRHKSRVLLVTTGEGAYGQGSCNKEGMRIAEAVADAYREQHGTDVRLARVFDDYGPGLGIASGHPVSVFIDRAMKGEDIKLAGDETEVRYLEYINDCVEGLWALMNTTNKVGKPIDIGTDVSTTMKELAEVVRKTVAEKTGQSLGGIALDGQKHPRDGAAFCRKPDVTATKKALGWQPRVGLEEGVGRIVDSLLHSTTVEDDPMQGE
jgi:UDP-glucuronate decarboxylase